jgi:hypothetical protein
MGFTISTHGSIITMGVIVLPCTDSPSHDRGSIRGITNQIMRVTREIKTRALRICNGRIGDDKGIGKFTSKNASVVDYAICSPLLFKIIDNFSALETSKLFSDIHNPLSMAFNCIRETTSTMLLIYTVNM